MPVKRTAISGPDELDILSAIWILACNDENPLISYEGIGYRLGLPSDYDVKGLICSRGEMFRRGVPVRRLETWKQEMRIGKHLPSWIRDIEAESERQAKIEALTIEDLFRSQFRAEVGAARSPIEIIEWGLEHINRLRKAGAEAREEKVRRVSGMWVPLLSMFVALTAVASSTFLQSKGINTQVEMKKYETVFKPKQEGYASFMKSLAETFDSAYHKDRKTMIVNLVKLEAAYFSIEPFLSEQERKEVWDKYQEFAKLCYETQKQRENMNSTKEEIPVRKDQFVETFFKYKDYFRTELYRALFKYSS